MKTNANAKEKANAKANAKAKANANANAKAKAKAKAKVNAKAKAKVNANANANANAKANVKAEAEQNEWTSVMMWEELKEFYRGKRVLVTGHTGFKGSWLTVLLSLCGAQVYGYALKPPTEPSLFECLYGKGAGARTQQDLTVRISDGAWNRDAKAKMGFGFSKDAFIGVRRSCIADICDFETLKAFYEEVRPDVVLHLAAQPIVLESYQNPRGTYETNVMGTVNLLECARLLPGCRSLLNVTTDKVYLNEERPGYGYKEDDRLDGYDPYSNSKSCSELVTHSYAASFLRAQGTAVSTARAGNVIGGGDFAKDRIIPDCVRAAGAGKDILLRNPNSTRPYQHVLEPLAVYLTIAMRQAQDAARYAGWYNVGPDDCDCVTTGELADLFVNAWEKATSGEMEAEKETSGMAEIQRAEQGGETLQREAETGRTEAGREISGQAEAKQEKQDGESLREEKMRQSGTGTEASDQAEPKRVKQDGESLREEKPWQSGTGRDGLDELLRTEPAENAESKHQLRWVSAVPQTGKPAPHEANFLKLDNTKAKEVLGWRPVWHIGQAVQATAEWSAAWINGGEAEVNATLIRQIRDYFSSGC